MEFLLLLSAMLTALTGAITGVRAPEPRVQQVASAAIIRSEATLTAASRPAPARPAVRVEPTATMPVVFALADAVPLYLGRLRI